MAWCTEDLGSTPPSTSQEEKERPKRASVHNMSKVSVRIQKDGVVASTPDPSSDPAVQYVVSW